MIEELKPCPFCGEDGEADIYHDSDGNWYIRCTYCESAERHDIDKAEAIKEWNNRPIEDELKTSRDFAREHNTMHIKALASLQRMYADKVDELKALKQNH